MNGQFAHDPARCAQDHAAQSASRYPSGAKEFTRRWPSSSLLSGSETVLESRHFFHSVTLVLPTSAENVNNLRSLDPCFSTLFPQERFGNPRPGSHAIADVCHLLP